MPMNRDNGHPTTAPSADAPELARIAYAKIFPPVGIARLGDSEDPDGWFVAAEWPGQRLSADPRHRYKDGAGRVRRQAARFRVYGFDAANEVVAELTADTADIEWKVALANRKASAFRFNGAYNVVQQFLDPDHEPAGSGASRNDPWRLRNDSVGRGEDGTVDAAERIRLLDIDGGAQSFATNESTPGEKPFVGRFLDKVEVYLGELRLDAQGRLLVLGGRGKSQGLDVGGKVDANNWITTYANNDLWYDDASDGPVTATVKLKEQSRTVEVRGAAWVIVAPPDFSPDTENLVTLFDVLQQTSADRGLTAPELGSLSATGETSFWRDVFPLFHRMRGYSWVNSMGLRGHGIDKPGYLDLDDAKLIAKLADPAVTDRAIESRRAAFLQRVRKPWHYLLADDAPISDPDRIDQHPDFPAAVDQANPRFMPPLSGDQGDRQEGSPETWLALTPLQYRHLERWAAGEFVTGEPPAAGDANPAAEPPPLPGQPSALTRTAVDHCAGGAFYPGIEITAIVRCQELFAEAFRFDHARLRSGSITRHMALPWQADFYACNTWWWPAQRPDDVVHESQLTEIAEQFPTEREKGLLARLLFNRRAWARGINAKRPSLDRFRGSWLPEALPSETVETYSTRVLKALLDVWAEDVLADPPPAVGPWRRQFLEQEALDRYSGRYLQLIYPSPEELVISLLKARNKPYKDADEVLRRLRAEWPQVPRELGLDDPTAGGFTRAYQAYARERALEHLESVFRRLFATAETAAGLFSLLAVIVEDGASSTAVLMEEVDEGSIAHARLAFDEACQAIADASYLTSLDNDLGGYNGMVDGWRKLGFVVRRDVRATADLLAEVYAEAETARYDGLEYRDYFHILMNLDKFPDFFDYAINIVDTVLAQTGELLKNVEDPSYDGKLVERPFVYSAVTYDATLEQIYEYFRSEGAKMRPWLQDRTRDEQIQRFIDLAPFNQCDGSWLRFIADAGPVDEIHATLFEIWSDEVGNGDPALHHGNLYTSLLRSLGVVLPDLESAAYADSPLFGDEAFVSPVFQLAISLHAKRYFAELLGMTLFLEWEVLELVAGIKRQDYLGFDTQFLRMHVGIDNAEDGHGAKAKRAVELHLANALNEGGEAALQAEWQRIWTGFWAFATAGYDYKANDAAVARRRPAGIESRLRSLVLEKAGHGRLNHSAKQLEGNRLNDLFDDPSRMLRLLAASQWVVPGDAEGSRLLSYLTTFEGPMYKVFNAAEIALWREWIIWLGKEGGGILRRYLNKEQSMLAVLRILTASAQAPAGHQRYAMTPEGGGSPEVIAEWFADAARSGDYRPLMRALVDHRWVLPYDPDNSPLVVDLLRGDRAMGLALDRRFRELNGQIGRRAIVDWIAAGCPIDGKPRGPLPANRSVERLESRSIVQVFGKGSIH